MVRLNECRPIGPGQAEWMQCCPINIIIIIIIIMNTVILVLVMLNECRPLRPGQAEWMQERMQKRVPGPKGGALHD